MESVNTGSIEPGFLQNVWFPLYCKNIVISAASAEGFLELLVQKSEDYEHPKWIR